MLVLLSGAAKIEASDATSSRTREIGKVEPGDVVGEVAFFTSARRTASVVATEDGEVLHIDAARMRRVAQRFPKIAAKVYANLAQLLGRQGRANDATDLRGRQLRGRGSGSDLADIGRVSPCCVSRLSSTFWFTLSSIVVHTLAVLRSSVSIRIPFARHISPPTLARSENVARLNSLSLLL